MIKITIEDPEGSSITEEFTFVYEKDGSFYDYVRKCADKAARHYFTTPAVHRSFVFMEMTSGQSVRNFLEQFNTYASTGHLDAKIEWNAIGGLFDVITPDEKGICTLRLPIVVNRKEKEI